MNTTIEEVAKREKNSHCRHNFPMPPMRSTKVLEPIALVDETLNEKAKFIYNILEKKQYNSNNTFNEFLDELHLTETDYMLAIQSSLKQPMILLQRKPSHTWNNIFATNMPKLGNANTDAQFVLNAYAGASYCTSYMTKADKSMTNAFKRIRREHEKSKLNAIEMICSLANALFNLQQISAQQAVHIILSLPLNHSS